MCVFWLLVIYKSHLKIHISNVDSLRRECLLYNNTIKHTFITVPILN